MGDEGLYETLAAGFRPRADDPALITDAATWTYADVDGWTARVVDALGSLGVAAGDRVAVQGRSRPSACSPTWACSAPVPCSSRSTRPTAPTRWPTSSTMPSRRSSSAPTGSWSLDDGSWPALVADRSPDSPARPIAGHEPAAFLYTSGTTGRSKGAVLTHRNLASNAATLHAAWGFVADDVLVHALPIFHTHGLFVATNTALLSGIPIRFHERFDAAAVLADLPRSTVFMGVPTMYTRLLAAPGLDAATCGAMRLFTSGSAPLLPETFEAFRTRTGHTILERYGMTETGMLTSNPYAGERRVGTVGVALPGVDVRVVDDTDAPAPPARAGRCRCGAPTCSPAIGASPTRPPRSTPPTGGSAPATSARSTTTAT